MLRRTSVPYPQLRHSMTYPMVELPFSLRS